MKLTLFSGNQFNISWGENLLFMMPNNIEHHLDNPDYLIKTAIQIRDHCMFIDNSPLSTKLPFSYQLIPQRIRNFIAHFIGRRKRTQQKKWAYFPQFPLDLSVDLLYDLAHQSSPFKSKKTPVLISHDLDTPEGLKNLIIKFLDMEEFVNARSANYIVPFGWTIDKNLLNNVYERGHEIGIHGYDHSNKTPYVSSEHRKKRLNGANALIQPYKITGYRAPSLVRTKELLQDLMPLYQYDTSIPTSGGLFPQPNNGCATARPFFIDQLLEIPITLPRDGSLLFLGYSPEDILKTWINCANIIAKSGGVVHLLTHCEHRFSGKSDMLLIYQKFLDYIASQDQFEFSTTQNICAYYA